MLQQGREVSSRVDGQGVFGLIKADRATAGKAHLRNRPPSCFLNRVALDTFLCQGRDLGVQIVADEKELVDAILIGRVECGFSRWQGKDQPAMAGIHGLEPENVAEKQSICLGVFGVHDYMSGKNHFRPSIA